MSERTAASQPASIVRWRGGSTESVVDELAREEPLQIRVDGRPVSVTMRTPGNDEELAVGFLLGEALIAGRDDVRDVRPLERGRDCNTVDVRLRPGLEIDFERLSRNVYASSSCGLCGKTTIAAVRQSFPPVTSELRVEAGMLAALPARLRAAQATFDRTGGLHAAAVFTGDGELLVVREDVGRHNAVDKALGWGLLAGPGTFPEHVLLVSGRSSFEIMQKALAGRLPIVAAVSAPSSLAVQFAQESGQTLVGFLRDGGMNLYAGAERIGIPDPTPDRTGD
jgi:FdhD protein